MRRLLLALGALALAIAPALSGSLPLVGAGKPAGAACFSYPGGAIYQSLALTDGWGATNATLTTGGPATPICGTLAATLKEDTSNAGHNAYKNPTVTGTFAAGQAYTVTVWIKQTVGSRDSNIYIFTGDFTSNVQSYIVLGSCSNGYTNANGSGFAANPTMTGTVVSGWCKAAITFTPASAFTNLQVQPGIGSGYAPSYAGDGASTLAFAGLDVR